MDLPQMSKWVWEMFENLKETDDVKRLCGVAGLMQRGDLHAIANQFSGDPHRARSVIESPDIPSPLLEEGQKPSGPASNVQQRSSAVVLFNLAESPDECGGPAKWGLRIGP